VSILKKFKSSKGFTLIELLVVIAIIGVLATLILLQLGIARAKARDAKRIADVNQLRTAVELYFDDRGGSYPGDSLCPVKGFTGTCRENTATAFNGNGLLDYLSARILPQDPLAGTEYKYAYSPSTDNVRKGKYHIWAELERQNAPALAGDVDINSNNTTTFPTGAGDMTDASNATLTEACKNVTGANDCVYDLGQQ